MRSSQEIDRHARDISPRMQSSVFKMATSLAEKRVSAFQRDYTDPDRLRRLAGQIKQHTLEHLDHYLELVEKQFRKKGVKVHFASTGDRCNQIVLDILQQNDCRKIVKSKSMLSEETELNSFLSQHGVESVETDLGELIVQLDNDHPSHIIAPIIHKSRREMAQCFEREGLGDYNDEPEVITRRARDYLRKQYMEADAGLTGANFVVAESGRISLVTNEGNARFCLAATRVHIVIVGIEKILPRDRDLALFHNIIARSGTGQRLTVYNQFIGGPKANGQPHGPQEMHVVLVDNRRTEVLASNCREILRCIRCGACQNICPVYRQASGFAYRGTYGGPVGSVLSPLLAGENFGEKADLPKASSLCGACREVCPVDIPIPDLLLRLRDKGKREAPKKSGAGTPPMGIWATMASHPATWNAALRLGYALNIPHAQAFPIPALQAWCNVRKLPPWRGGKFRQWMDDRKDSPK